jgi:DNA-binding response OmpR family regulator
MRLLVAEDDGFFQRLLKEILTPQHELFVAHDGYEAWEVLQRPDAPRLAILDWVMPGLSGPEICRKVRACPSLSSIYLIILTAKNNQADIVSGLRAGADDYLTKPPIPAELQARIKVGERILALQDAVAAQSATYDRAAGREKFLCESLARCPRCPKAPDPDSLCGLQDCPFDPGPGRSSSCAETVGLMQRLSKQFLGEPRF